jgi:hypothetical protein
MKLMALIFSVILIFLTTIGSADVKNGAPTLEQIRSEYADVLALEGTSKQEILAIARLLRAKPEMAIDRTAAAGEYCLKSDFGTMVHFASNAATTSEDVVYEFDASPLINAGLDPGRLMKLPSLGKMEPGKWYFLPLGTEDPHHQHKMATPIVAIAINVK